MTEARQKAAIAVCYANFLSRSHRAVIRVYDAAGKVIIQHETALSRDRNRGSFLREVDRMQHIYEKFYSRSDDTVIRVYDMAANVIETHEHAGDFKEW